MMLKTQINLFHMTRTSALTAFIAGTAIVGTTAGVQAQTPHLGAMMAPGTVIPVRLNNNLSSSQSRIGDRFTANVVSNRSGYARLRGVVVEGIVTDAAPKDGRKPGVLRVSFRRVYGRMGAYRIRGGAVPLTSAQVNMNQAPYSVKPSYDTTTLTGSTYKLDGTKGHDVSLKRGEQIGLVVL